MSQTPRPYWMPVFAATISAVFWGLWWIPIRYFEAQGLPGIWPGLLLNLGAVLAIAVWMLVTRTGIRLSLPTLFGAFLIGSAFATYSIALTYSEVVRVVLLFYLSPVWSKILEWAFLRMPWRWTTTAALIAALLGAFLVLGGDVSTTQLGFGDWLAVISGLCWAGGATLVFSGDRVSVVAQAGLASGSAVLVSIPFAFLASWPSTGLATTGLAMGLGMLYVIPLSVLTLWSAQRLAPATITFLLTAEILSGVISSAILLDEPFGLLHASGAALVILAATFEIFSGVRAVGAKSN